MDPNFIIPLIIWPPLIGFLINGIFGTLINKRIVTFIAIVMPLLSLVGTFLAYTYFDNPYNYKLYQWFDIEKELYVNFGFYIDHLTIIMLFIITGVGTLIHVYSGGYMHDDKGFARFMSYMNLFLFAMILLVTASNIMILFVGWEGVGLCSFLLIGFWFKNVDYNKAARKAFVMNRIGDLGFLIGVFLIAFTFDTLDIQSILFKLAETKINDPNIILITICLFIGAVGKSAQIPLFTWLPDAMAGPTPVSALIHAATMVTAGIYLISRMHGLFELVPITNTIISSIGLATALVAATIALKQNDIKKVLAYSTVSQLGYMVVALGCGAYITAIFHVMTHAFFKALLFLSAGSVIHGLHGEQDIQNMGGLRSKMKWTHLVFLIGTLAIVGCPPLAGFFSKDEILAKAYSSNFWLFFGLACASVCTAWYMFRIYFATFFGSFRGSEQKWEKVHESPAIMLVPLFVLALFSIIGGFFGMPEIMHQTHFIGSYLSTVIKEPKHEISHFFEYSLWATTILVLAIISWITYKRYGNATEQTFNKIPNSIGLFLSKKYYLDEIYDFIIVRPLKFIGTWFKDVFEFKFVRRVVYSPGFILNQGSVGLKSFQSGNISWYIISMIIGLIAFFLLFLK